jgi:hypothetical protein
VSVCACGKDRLASLYSYPHSSIFVSVCVWKGMDVADIQDVGKCPVVQITGSWVCVVGVYCVILSNTMKQHAAI